MASKVSTLCMIAFLLLSFNLTYAARPEPGLTPTTQNINVEGEAVQVEDSCEGLEEQECLMRRTLAAHIDYIYTQKHNP